MPLHLYNLLLSILVHRVVHVCWYKKHINCMYVRMYVSMYAYRGIQGYIGVFVGCAFIT